MLHKAIVVFAVIAAVPAAAEESRVAQILDRLENANANRDHVMIVAHRGGWMVNGEIQVAENSLQAIDRAVEVGAEMVEVDVRLTADGQFIVMHDETLDRTTTCSGEVAEMNWDEIKSCQLKVDGTGEVIDETIPTLADVYDAVQGRVLINLDTKVDVAEIAKMFALAEEMDVSDHVLATAAAHNDEDLAAAVAMKDALGGAVNVMPNIYDAKLDDVTHIEEAITALDAEVLQTRNQQEEDAQITEDGGAMYGFGPMADAIKYDVHWWINTLYSGDSEPNGRRSGGRGDEMAVLAGLPHEVYGFWAEQGATMIQTDEPEAAIKWLEKNGYRKPYRNETASEAKNGSDTQN